MMHTDARSLAMTLALTGALVCASADARAGGFEIPENTTKSVARGGTGVALKNDPSALYFNPALLSRVGGFQLLLNTNMVDLDVDFQRAPLTYRQGSNTITREFDPVSNSSNWFPAPFLTLSWDMGIENFALALGVFGPSAYSGLCYGDKDASGNCTLRGEPEVGFEGNEQLDPNGARHMMLEAELLQIYFTLGAGYAFNLPNGAELGVGVAGALAYQRNSFELVIDADFQSKPPWEEDPLNEARFAARDLVDYKPTAFLGLSYRHGGLNAGVSYRPPIRWEGEGTAEVTLTETLQEVTQAELTDDRVTLRTWQAGTLRAGIGWTEGTHPRFEDRPRLELETNLVWEDWSRVKYFEVEPAGDFDAPTLGQTVPINTIQQDKSWQDTMSLRFGGSYAINKWVTAHAGALAETATQSNEYTNADFIAWERYAGGLGATIHATDWLDIDLGYMYIGLPKRTVTNGQVYNAIPLSSCTGPDYDDESCEQRGTPPGNPQNAGDWTARFQIASAGLTLHFD